VAEAIPRSARAFAGLLLVLLLTGLAGCSALGSSEAAPTTTTQLDRVAIWREVIRCLRTHGMPNLPDPQVDRDGEPHFPGGDPGEPPERARQACEPIYNRLPPARGEQEQERAPADIPALLRFARCMREHGMPDWPDPKADGTFPIVGTSIEREGKSSRFLRAARACRQLNPDPTGSIHGS
jgi:hypothetical protein